MERNEGHSTLVGALCGDPKSMLHQITNTYSETKQNINSQRLACIASSNFDGNVRTPHDSLSRRIAAATSKESARSIRSVAFKQKRDSPERDSVTNSSFDEAPRTPRTPRGLRSGRIITANSVESARGVGSVALTTWNDGFNYVTGRGGRRNYSVEQREMWMIAASMILGFVILFISLCALGYVWVLNMDTNVNWIKHVSVFGLREQAKIMNWEVARGLKQVWRNARAFAADVETGGVQRSNVMVVPPNNMTFSSLESIHLWQSHMYSDVDGKVLMRKSSENESLREYSLFAAWAMTITTLPSLCSSLGVSVVTGDTSLPLLTLLDVTQEDNGTVQREQLLWSAEHLSFLPPIPLKNLEPVCPEEMIISQDDPMDLFGGVQLAHISCARP